MKEPKKLYTLSFIIYGLVVFSVSSYPSLDVPRLTSEFFELDKIAHFFQYFIFTFLYYQFRKYNGILKKDIYLEIFFLGMLVPIFDEMHQIPIPGRTFEWYDVIADVLGCYIMFLLIYIKNKNK